MKPRAYAGGHQVKGAAFLPSGWSHRRATAGLLVRGGLESWQPRTTRSVAVGCSFKISTSIEATWLGRPTHTQQPANGPTLKPTSTSLGGGAGPLALHSCIARRRQHGRRDNGGEGSTAGALVVSWNPWNLMPHGSALEIPSSTFASASSPPLSLMFLRCLLPRHRSRPCHRRGVPYCARSGRLLSLHRLTGVPPCPCSSVTATFELRPWHPYPSLSFPRSPGPSSTCPPSPLPSRPI